MTTPTVYENYLLDLGRHIRELALSALDERRIALNGEDRAFASGRLIALHEVVSLMQQQATAFGISLADLGLADLNPEQDLV